MEKDLYLVIDIGGTKMLVTIFDEEGNILFRKKVPTPANSLPQKLVNEVTSLAAVATEHSECELHCKIKAVGICFAGFVEYPEGLIHQAPNLGWKKPVALARLFKEIFKVPVIIENDANAAVVGEVYFGAAQGHRDVIYVTLSTGIGGGLFLNNSLYRGGFGFAGEIGHTKSFGKGRLCNCGKDDCLEIWASGNGILSSALELWEPGDLNLNQLTTPAVFEEADKGNPLAILLIDQAINNVSLGLSNLVNIINPSCLVIGGGIIAARPQLLNKLETGIRMYAIQAAAEKPKLEIKKASLGADSGIWGIYALLSNRELNKNGKR